MRIPMLKGFRVSKVKSKNRKARVQCPACGKLVGDVHSHAVKAGDSSHEVLLVMES